MFLICQKLGLFFFKKYSTIKLMKKIFAGFFLVAFLVFIGGFVYGSCQYGDPPKTCPDCPEPGGLVPCGRTCNDPDTSECECEPCTLCHFFLMIKKIIDFLLFKIVPPLAALMIAIGGGMYVIARGKPEMLTHAKQLFGSVIIGLLIIYGAWLIINTFFMLIGIADWTGLEQGWWQINCL